MKIKTLLSMALVLITMATVSMAATTNPPAGAPGYTPMVMPIYGTISSASIPGAVKFTAPAGYNVIAASVTARAVSGSNTTLKVRLNSGSFVNYSGTVSAAGTTKSLTAGSTTKIADESTVAVDLVTGGTAPKWRDLTLFILLKRL